MVYPNDYALTPTEGRVYVVRINPCAYPYPETASVIHLHNHNGYVKGQCGLYLRTDLWRVVPLETHEILWCEAD